MSSYHLHHSATLVRKAIFSPYPMEREEAKDELTRRGYKVPYPAPAESATDLDILRLLSKTRSVKEQENNFPRKLRDLLQIGAACESRAPHDDEAVKVAGGIEAELIKRGYKLPANGFSYAQLVQMTASDVNTVLGGMPMPPMPPAPPARPLSAGQVGGSHYKDMDISPWDVMKATLTREEWLGFLKGNVIKYTMRAGRKDGAADDEEKAAHYFMTLTKESKE